MAEDTEAIAAEGAGDIDISRPSILDKTTQLRIFKQEFSLDRSHSAKWRVEAKEDFGFVAGDQWTTDEKAQLKDQLRPEIVFNRSITIIKAVAGFEINGRHEIQFLPRTIEDAALNETLTGASKWMADECDGEDEESEAFQDSLICGLGCTENRMDYELDPQGMYVESEVDPLEMYWHYTARKKNISDAQRIWRLRKVSVSDGKALFPGKTRDQLDASWAVGDMPNEPEKTLEQKRVRDENSEGLSIGEEIHVLERQWYEREPMWLVADPATDSKVELSDDQYKLLTERAKQFQLEITAVRIYRRRYKRAFIGSEVLETTEGPLPDRFSYAFITGQLDKNKGTWFGLIRIMRDPAKWANKWLSQTLHMMNVGAKGGIFAEKDFFDDQRQGEETYAKPEAVTVVSRGALGDPALGKPPKWAPKPQMPFPAGFYQLLEFAISSLRDVTGINLELLGQKDINQPGILEAQRKQAGMTVLATMFDSLRRFRKQVGRIRLYYIQNFLSDGRLIRIAGPEGAKVIPLLKDKTSGQYDVEIDDAPTSPNQKQANWAVIAPMVPMFKDELMKNPSLLIEVLKSSPLPARLVGVFETILNQPPSPDVVEAKEMEKAGKVAAINKDQSVAELNNAKAGASQATAMYDIALAQKMMRDGDMTGLSKQLEDMHKAAQIDTERAKADKLSADTHGQHADTANTHADTVHTGVRTVVDMLTHAAQQQAGTVAGVPAQQAA